MKGEFPTDCITSWSGDNNVYMVIPTENLRMSPSFLLGLVGRVNKEPFTQCVNEEWRTFPAESVLFAGFERRDDEAPLTMLFLIAAPQSRCVVYNRGESVRPKSPPFRKFNFKRIGLS
jgi:hypothetical protein